MRAQGGLLFQIRAASRKSLRSLDGDSHLRSEKNAAPVTHIPVKETESETEGMSK